MVLLERRKTRGARGGDSAGPATLFALRCLVRALAEELPEERRTRITEPTHALLSPAGACRDFSLPDSTRGAARDQIEEIMQGLVPPPQER